MVNRHCASCKLYLSKQDFSTNQWRKPIGASRCITCVQGGNSQSQALQGHKESSRTARRNNASRASYEGYDLDNPFAEGGFRWVAKGTYTEGMRKGEACVTKWFKTGCVFEATFYDKDIQAMQKTLSIVDEFNAAQIVNQVIKVNIPEVWTFTDDSGDRWARTKTLVEPFIANYEKFNSNSGWANNATPWPRVMQALSHFSYHVSGGQYVLCDLQGGKYSNGVILTDPVIMSRTAGTYGVTDMGPLGISSFFAGHRCNEYCRSGWKRPADQRRYFKPKMGTSMMDPRRSQHHVPNLRSRPPMSQLNGISE